MEKLWDYSIVEDSKVVRERLITLLSDLDDMK